MTFLLIALALLTAPPRTARRRLRALRGSPTRWSTADVPLPRDIRRWVPRPVRGPVAVGFGAVGFGAVAGLLLGVGGVIAGALLGLTLWKLHVDRRKERVERAARQAIAEGLAAFVAELRSGVDPSRAALGAAEDAEPPAAEVFATVAATARRGGDVEKALAGNENAHTGVRQLARAWRLSGDHGVPLADVLEAVRDDLRRRARFARHVHARMAGPRASAAVLAALPVLGVLLGELTGSHPLGVLTGSGAGQVLLVVGVALVCAGLRWSAHLTKEVMA
ncbi:MULTISPECIES: type II secretion system F family protein [unclassified Saccharothrix]|uniref:type II secretion system F family protein n=1 Tax=unclassified Saccharothrix TaxID=2593673 RepID=UPI00307EA8CF